MPTYFNRFKVGEIRPNQLITTFGPGSIIDAKKDSVTILDLNYWDTSDSKIIKDSRFSSYLKVDYFKVPNFGGKKDIPVVSFPDIHICPNPKCNRLFSLKKYFNEDKYLKLGPVCPDCGQTAYPSRFVLACENGHMQDFPWNLWLHGDNSCNGELKLYSSGYTSSLGDMIIECTTCHKKKNLSNITDHVENNFKCKGLHPFRPSYPGCNCKQPMFAYQRGASNIYFPLIKSAISIPPYTDKIYQLIDTNMVQIRTLLLAIPDKDEALRKTYELFFSTCGSSFDEFKDAYSKREAGVKDYVALKEAEYKAIVNHNDPAYKKSKRIFMAEEETVPDCLKVYFSRIIRVTRLREIMALTGFTRVDAPDPEAESQPNMVELNKGVAEHWLPAVEVNGEGIFIEFNKNTLANWLNDNSIKDIDRNIMEKYDEYCKKRDWENVSTRGAKYVLLHTFAHLLIKEMGMQSGYSTSAIKERIYCNDIMQGVLLYTGSSDKEGSLGGLVELGMQYKFLPILKQALQNALFCTNDPECMLSSIDNNVNGAACHSCCMISETACENGNRLLDRSLLIPLAERNVKSYFADFVDDIILGKSDD